MDRIQEKFKTLRAEADTNATLNEELKGKNKTLETELLAKHQEVTSLTHRNQVLEEKLETLEQTAKEASEKHNSGSIEQGHLQRKIQAVESERDSWESKYEEMSKKYMDVQKELKELSEQLDAF